MPRLRSLDTTRIDSLFQRDDRVASHSELIGLGVPASTITYRIRHGGPWTRLLPGVIVAHSGKPTWHQRLMGAVKYAGEGAVVTGLSALHHHGFRSVPWSSDVYMLTPHARKRQSREYVVIERTTRMPKAAVVGRIPYTPVARSVIDACRQLRDLDLIRAIVSEAVQSDSMTTRGILVIPAAPGDIIEDPDGFLRDVQGTLRSAAERPAPDIRVRRADAA